MDMKKTGIFLVLICISLSLTIACTLKKAEVKKPVRIGLTVWGGTAHAYIAKEKGIFKKNNVEVELVLEKDDPAMLRSYKNGKLDGMLTVAPDVVILNSEGIPARIVYITDYSDSGDMIIGKPGLKSLSGLRGKTVSFQGINTFSHMYVLSALEKAGLKEYEVYFKNVEGSAVLNALEKGMIDAGHTWDPTLSQAIKKGYIVLSKAGDIPGVITDVLVFSDKLIRGRPDEVYGIVRSLLEARDFIFTNRDEALKIMAAAEGMSRDEITSGINGVHMLDLADNVKAMQESKEEKSLYNITKRMSEFYLKRGQLTQIPDVKEIVDPAFIKRLNEERKK